MDKKPHDFVRTILTDLNKPWEKALHMGSEVSFSPKNIIPCGNSTAPECGMYYIKRGRVRLSYIAANGVEKILFYLGRGTIFNEIPMLLVTNNAIFTSIDETEAVFIPRKKITNNFARDYPELLLNLLESISSKAGNFHAQLCAMGVYPSFVNVCRTLYSMHLYNQERSGIVPQLSKQELAAFLGLHRSSLHKALTRLQDEGVIGAYNRRSLSIYNNNLLYEYAMGLKED